MTNLFSPTRFCVAFLLFLGLAGCQNTKKTAPELTTVEVENGLEIAPPAPIEPESTQPNSLRVGTSQGASSDWPGQWTEGWIPLTHFCRLVGAKLSLPARGGEGPGYRIESVNGPLELRANSRVASWGGVQFWLAYGPRLMEDRPCVHALDARKSLYPLCRSASPAFTGRRLVLDPGHGGRNLGTQSILGTDREKDLVLDWAFRLQRILLARGWDVVLTRTNDVELTLSDRIRLADAARADLFLSLHLNSASPNADRTGIETYCVTPVGLPSTLVRFDQDDPSRIFPNNDYDDLNFLLAMQVQQALVRHTGAMDRGVRRARFMSVLRGQRRPAILIEGGFLSTESEAEKLATPEYRQLLAESVAAGLDGLGLVLR